MKLIVLLRQISGMEEEMLTKRLSEKTAAFMVTILLTFDHGIDILFSNVAFQFKILELSPYTQLITDVGLFIPLKAFWGLVTIIICAVLCFNQNWKRKMIVRITCFVYTAIAVEHVHGMNIWLDHLEKITG